ncbi:MAG TPA: MgtC/SapB family protein [Xanthobacteraceae bacterium]|nr:MgtC/SapB family protein [Xanthobacteraceae bacterium]
MPLHLTVADVLIRFACALIASALIGYNRGEHGKAAGLRTTMLVCLAAAVAMLQVNYLLPLAGRSTDSFVMNDLMRFPLGVLTGVGFIGGGAILRRDSFVTGVTTAATLWYVTMIGLAFGGGQIVLGWIATLIGAAILWALGWLERRVVREFRGRLTVALDAAAAAERDLAGQVQASGLVIAATTVDIEPQCRTLVYEVLENRTQMETDVPALVTRLAREPGVRRVYWQPVS